MIDDSCAGGFYMYTVIVPVTAGNEYLHRSSVVTLIFVILPAFSY